MTGSQRTGHQVWLRAEIIESRRLLVEPLRVEHEDEMAPLLGDQALHEHIGGEVRWRSKDD